MSYTSDPKPSSDDDTPTPEEWDEEVLTELDAELPDAENPEPVPPT